MMIRSTLATVFVLLFASTAHNGYSATLSLNYQCVFPLLEEQPLIVNINAEIPDRVTVGELTPAFSIDAIATVSESAWNGLDFVGTRTLSGRVTAAAELQLPNGTSLDLAVPMQVSETELPPQRQSFTVRAAGETPALVFSEPGTAVIRVGDVLLDLSPRDAADLPTGIGDFQSECLALPGQQTVLQQITLVAANSADEKTFSLTGNLSLAKARQSSSLTGSLRIVGDDTDSDNDGSLTLSAFTAALRIGSLFSLVSAEGRLEPVADAPIHIADDAGAASLTTSVDILIPTLQARLFGLSIGNIGGPDCRLPGVALNLDGTLTNDGELTGNAVLSASTGCRVGVLVDALLTGASNPLTVALTTSAAL